MRFILIFILFPLSVVAQQLRYEDYVYVPEIKAVQCYNSSQEQSFPAIPLNSGIGLRLSFDDISGTPQNIFYSIEPCTPEWKPANLQQLEYMEGFAEDRIANYQFSYNTLQKYVHYELQFPNENMRPTISGNFLLKVYKNNDPNQLLFTRRFLIVENIVPIGIALVQSPVVDERFKKHKIDFTINIPKNYQINNPFSDLRIVVMQNNRWDNCQYTTKPLFIRDNQLIYSQNESNIFDAGNEFRKFDMRSLRYQSERVGKIKIDTLNEVFLVYDIAKTFDRYVFLNDFNGNYFVRVQEFNNPPVEADYAWVNFTLRYSPVFTDGDVYITGKLTDWQYTSANKMQYDYAAQAYRGKLYLKQGVYDYQYVLLPKTSKKPDITITEGQRFETENEYTVYVYHQAVGANYFRIVGVNSLKSNTLIR